MELGTRAWRWFYQLFSSQGPAARLLQGQGIRDGCSRRIISFPFCALTEKCSHSSISFSTRDSPAGLELAATSSCCAKTLLHTGNKINHWILTVQLTLPHTSAPGASSQNPGLWQAQPPAVCGIGACKGRGFATTHLCSSPALISC